MEPSEALRKAKELVAALAKRRGAVGKAAAKVLLLLEDIETGLQETGRTEAVTRQSKHGVGKVEYRVEVTSTGETLAEHRRSGASQPFRCPRTLYDATAQVLADATSPLSIDDIAASVEAKQRVKPADFQIRVPIRLWLSVDPPLIIRHRARYRKANVGAFPTAATELWQRLRAEQSS